MMSFNKFEFTWLKPPDKLDEWNLETDFIGRLNKLFGKREYQLSFIK